MTLHLHDHRTIDRRGLALARAIVDKLEMAGVQEGVDKARAVNRRWREMATSALHEAWDELL